MRRRLLLMGPLFFLSLGLGWGEVVSQYSATISATQTNTAVTFNLSGTGGITVLLTNDGPQTAHVNLAGTVATTSHFPLASGESLSLTNVNSGLGIICASGQTASVRVGAWRQR